MPIIPLVLKVTGAIAVPVVTALATRYMSQQMDVKVASRRQAHIEDLAASAVRYSEQRFKNATPGPSTNAAKLEGAIDYLIRSARRAGIKLDRRDAAFEVEVAVHALRATEPAEDTAEPAPDDKP